ncbi:MAG: Gfo/Idh/MocA family protein [Bacteroidia bacterium]
MIKIGLIGANETSRQHLQLLKEIPGFEVIGFFDHNGSTADEFAASHRIQRFDQFELLLNEVDAIDILSPVGSHYKYASEAITHSKHVLLSGLISEDIREARSINELAIEANVNLKILHAEKLHPEFRVFKRLVKKPSYVECRRFKNNILNVSNDALVFGMLLNDIDMLITVIGSNVRKVVANGASLYNTFTDFLNVRLEFENGCVANVNCGNFENMEPDTITVYQKNELLLLNLSNYQIRKMTRSEDGKYVDTEVNTKRKSGQNVISLELQQFAQSIENKLKMSNEVYQSYQSLRIAHQVIEKLHPTTLFNA